MLYFLLHNTDAFHDRISPALALSWRQRSFQPIVELTAELDPVLNAFADRYHLTADEMPLVCQLTEDRPFDRRLWRHVAGEILLYAAADAPTIQTAAETLMLLVAPDQRETIREAHAGSRDLEFNGVAYRPGHAGLNDSADLARLTDALADIDPIHWSATNLGYDDAAEELAFVGECLEALRGMYQQARQAGHVVICEEI